MVALCFSQWLFAEERRSIDRGVVAGYDRAFAEAAQRDTRKGVAFKQKSLDDLGHRVFAQRLAQRLPATSGWMDYGDYLRNSVRSQGDVLGDMNWEKWEVTKAAMELCGVNPGRPHRPQDNPGPTPCSRQSNRLVEGHAATAESQARSFLQSSRRLEAGIRDRAIEEDQGRR